MEAEFEKSPSKYDIIAVEGAIIIEAKFTPLFDEIWVTTLKEEIAIERILERNPKLAEPEALQRI